MERDCEQLLDILFDYCAVDIERLANTGAPPRALAEELIRNLVFTAACEPEAFRLLERLVRNERADRNSARDEAGY